MKLSINELKTAKTLDHFFLAIFEINFDQEKLLRCLRVKKKSQKTSST